MSLRLALPVLCFVATYALHAFVRRPVLIYSAVPLLPFAFAAIGLAVSWAAGRWGPKAGWTLAALLVASNLYLYPLATGRAVPPALYGHVLSRIYFGGL